MTRKGFLPPTPKWLDDNVLLRPSLSMEIYAKADAEKKFIKVVSKKSRKECIDCGFYHPETHIHCGLYSLSCINDPSRPRFLSKETVELARKELNGGD